MSRFRTPIHRELSRRLRDVVGADSAAEMARLGLVTLGDLLRHVPRRYLAGTEMSDFRALHPGEDVAVVAKVVATTMWMAVHPGGDRAHRRARGVEGMPSS